MKETLLREEYEKLKHDLIDLERNEQIVIENLKEEI
jgi:hypothetical protein